MSLRRAFLIATLSVFALLMTREWILVFTFGEYEPKFGLFFKIAPAAIFFLIVAAVCGGLLVLLLRIGRRSLLAVALLFIAAISGGVAFLRSDDGKRWQARRAVRYVYWRNFQARSALPSIAEFERPRAQLLLHGFGQLRIDPWNRPYRYELISDIGADHPHRKNWDLTWAFWSNGPDGLDDGHRKHDDVDVTNAGL